jgi:hypothetical protein
MISRQGGSASPSCASPRWADHGAPWPHDRGIETTGTDQGRADRRHSLGGVAKADVEARVRTICLALPEVTERLSHGSPAFFVGKQFVMLWPDGHHEDRFPHLWCAAPVGAQDGLVAAAPERFFRPPYVGPRGWLGLRLDGRVDWEEVEAICEDAYRTVAPERLVARLGPTNRAR